MIQNNKYVQVKFLDIDFVNKKEDRIYHEGSKIQQQLSFFEPRTRDKCKTFHLSTSLSEWRLFDYAVDTIRLSFDVFNIGL
jgi:hypothetical protein